ncbi:MAG TPA: hypothetical protein DHV56_14480 [Rhodobacter sp.]|nr:hypothetical protein [Rhodobacter sp.]
MSKTAAEIRSELKAKRITVPDWARTHNYPVRAVRAVLYGHNKGHFGQSHRIAVSLGLKEQPK